MPARVLTTPRLRMTGAASGELEAELRSREALAQSLGAVVPDAWPPGLYDRAAIQWSLDQLKDKPPGWIWTSYFIVHEGTLVGICGYKGGPSAEGMVEIGYSVLEAYQKRGIATEAAGALVEQAFSRPEVKLVAAETLPELTASIRVLEKNGFRFAGAGSEDGTIRYELIRPPSRDQE
jgi:RimJ/RimL family protein N-acetyltransferase